MDQLVRTTLELEQYECERCGRFFYINKIGTINNSPPYICPYGCTDSTGDNFEGMHTKTLRTEVKEVTAIEGDD